MCPFKCPLVFIQCLTLFLQLPRWFELVFLNCVWFGHSDSNLGCRRPSIITCVLCILSLYLMDQILLSTRLLQGWANFNSHAAFSYLKDSKELRIAQILSGTSTCHLINHPMSDVSWLNAIDSEKSRYKLCVCGLCTCKRYSNLFCVPLANPKVSLRLSVNMSIDNQYNPF
jgi:hypothetical protein